MKPATLIRRLAVPLALVWLSLVAAAPASGADGVQAVRVTPAGPLLDPAASFWSKAKPLPVALLPQTVTTPMHPDQRIKEVRVRAAHNGQWLAFRLDWQDETQSDRLYSDQFGDQVAVELPINYDKGGTLPSPMMGNPGGRVNVLQWRAAFQRDLDQGEPEIRTLYPNAVIDLYPDQVLRATDARPYQGGLGLDNPVSRGKDSPVLDQMAEGWGTMTVKPEQQADGRGNFKDGTWTVVITLPLAGGVNAPRLAPGGETAAAFAVWDGGGREVGSRKAWSMWVPVRLAR